MPMFVFICTMKRKMCNLHLYMRVLDGVLLAKALMIFKVATLPKTNIALENQWLQDGISLWDGLSSGATLVFGAVLL